MSHNFSQLLSLCKQRNLKITPQRQWVLECLHAATQPLTAYQLLDMYRKIHSSGEAMTIYRTLDYLEKKHIVHKIHSQNKYKLCEFNHTDTNVQLFFCNCCHSIQEIYLAELKQLLSTIAKQNQFKIEESMLEVLGLCHKCQQ